MGRGSQRSALSPWNLQLKGLWPWALGDTLSKMESVGNAKPVLLGLRDHGCRFLPSCPHRGREQGFRVAIGMMIKYYIGEGAL